MTNISRSGRHTVPLSVPYRVDLHNAGVDAPDTIDALVALGALDIDCPRQGAIAGLMPDRVTPEQVAFALGVGREAISVSPANGRDEGSVWVLAPRPISVGRLRIVPDGTGSEPDVLRLVDGPVFGTGLHPTTALCLEVLEEELRIALPDAVLDVGTGSGILALAALMLGVPRASAVDIDDDALSVAAENARINGVAARLQSDARRAGRGRRRLAAGPGQRPRRAPHRDGAGPCSAHRASGAARALGHPRVGRARSRRGIPSPRHALCPHDVAVGLGRRDHAGIVVRWRVRLTAGLYTSD